MARRLLVVVRDKPIEALRVAAGLTLSDAELRVLVLGDMPVGEQAETQLEALAFADVVPQLVPRGDRGGWPEVARAAVESDAVYLL